MKYILIIPNAKKDENLSVSEKLADVLSSYGAEIYIESKYHSDLSGKAKVVSEAPAFLDLIIVVGGDGSVLDASSLAIEKKTPILGVNLGRLGYLTEVEVDKLEMLSMLFEGAYTVEDKMLLEVSHVSDC